MLHEKLYHLTHSIYEIDDKYTREFTDAYIIYNGGYYADEDPADYVKAEPIKAVRLG